MTQEQSTKIIQRAALHLLETVGFMERYEFFRSNYDVTYEEAYEMTEAEYLEAFEKRKYRNAHNFRKSYNQFLARKEKRDNEISE